MRDVSPYHSAGMKKRLPANINPTALANANGVIEASVPAASLERLRSSAVAVRSDASVRMSFRREPDTGRVLMSLDAQVDVALACERCCETFDSTLQVQQCYLVDGVADDSELDAVETVEGLLDAAALIEDELILALPLVPKHEREPDCRVELSYGQVPAEPAKKSAFAALAALKAND